MQGLNVSEEGIRYLWLSLVEYSGGCIFVLLYALALVYLIIKGNRTEKMIFLPQALMLVLTVYNPVFPIFLNRLFDVNNEYYRFFWIAPVIFLPAYVMARLVFLAGGAAQAEDGGSVRTLADKKEGKGKGAAGVPKGLLPALVTTAVFTAVIVFGGKFLYSDGYIRTPNIYKMPTEIPVLSEMIHEDAEGRYDGPYYPRAICEFDYEMCLRQYDASIMLACTREQYLTAVMGKITPDDINSEEEYYSRLLAVVVNNVQIPSDEFRRGLENTGTEYVCVSTANRSICDYLEKDCKLRLVGTTANHSLYHYELQEAEGWRLPDYSDVWENY